MQKRRNDFGPIFWLHLFIIVLAYLSPILFSWKIFLVFLVFYYIQTCTLGYCFLTRGQLHINPRKGKKVTFYSYYFNKMGFKIKDVERLDFIEDYVIPPIILATAIILQAIFSTFPLII